jgi:hypothetical protein
MRQLFSRRSPAASDGRGGALTDFFSAGQSYYVDVKLIKSSSAGNPGFKSVAILSNGSL